jgi:hypothetical protein
MRGTAKMTGGGLTKSKLKMSDNGNIVSIKASRSAKNRKKSKKGGQGKIHPTNGRKKNTKRPPPPLPPHGHSKYNKYQDTPNRPHGHSKHNKYPAPPQPPKYNILKTIQNLPSLP